MNSHADSQRPESRDDAARASAPGAVRSFRSVLLGWTDPESGDRLAVRLPVRVDGDRALVSQLQKEGFELLGTEEAQSPLGAQANPSDSNTADADAAAADSTPIESDRTLSLTARLLSAPGHIASRIGRRNTA